jgi:hypothetical protein
MVEVDADGEQHNQDRSGEPVDDQAERRPPASVGHKVAAVLPEILESMAGEEPATSSHPCPVTPAAATTTNTAATVVSTVITVGRPSATAKPM